ncbi:TPA: siphovirus ReqiPepy6 Gp37-like family protein [Clostridium botulinum]|uniref:siphovirus ReqiPepy6 Gp37-like family protein n=1 Tax=Clostridium botulinum TaxID=1491 RepID=UPI000774043B|nr:siphovirus ReqiPepy6 Gp37-like family protein [Clostridium botulinum]HCL4466704.1 siphovirus ReqiPepy6 Gp37-like family protein [Clostridium botulinum]HCL4470346.1 siphovirus ReqiPepy6 Gp37-like family protein [Clostridium botulinum]HCL4485550.1 siphovirus ReqiPepy6 Gp37-like family protein [Clostridium botulinum]HCL4496308.1 siphovirus ReqiPepy6 Gp37-like family protein [Clostridium botulinum]HCL4499908.1 siphovirus ReqiPepy6 Gp37-like family protein [Clostridium botulinum]
MELYIFNRDLELKGILDTFTSLRWIRRYNKTGEFELHCPLDFNILDLLKRENIVYKKDDMEAGYIETRQLKINEDGQEYLEIKGRFLTNYLDRRINWDRVNFDGRTEELMRRLVLENAINPTNINRKIDNLILGNLKGLTEDIKYQNSFGNIIECLENISNTNNLGYRNLLDIKNRKILFDVYKGVDRTINNGTIAPCIFSRDFENILEQEYTDSLNNYKNTTLIAGAGEGKDRKLTSIESGIGLDRFELYVDARDIEDTETIKVTVPDYDEEGNVTGEHEEDKEVEIPWERYKPLLIQRGKEKLEECQEIQTFDSKINTQGNNVYKKDYDLGDIVTVIDKKWGIRIDTRITEIEEIYEEKGLEVNVVFGNNIPTIIDKIKQKVR